MQVVWFWSFIGLLTLAVMIGVAVPLWKNRQYSLGALISLLIIPVFSLSFYLWLGNSQQLQQFKTSQQLIDQLKAHLQQKPQSAEGWYLLGKLYLSNRNYGQAESSLNKAYQLGPDHAEYLLALAKVNFLNHEGHLNSSLETALKTQLKSIAQPIDALNLLAANAYQRKDYRQAIKLWRQALTLTPPDSPDSRALLDMIRQAQL